MNRVLKTCELLAACRPRGGQEFPFEVVIPLVEVQVAAAPFGFAALQVDGLGTEEFLRRNEVAAEVVVERDAVGVEAAEIKICDGRIGIVEPAESDIHR